MLFTFIKYIANAVSYFNKITYKMEHLFIQNGKKSLISIKTHNVNLDT